MVLARLARFQLIPEVNPLPSEAIFDKIAMSARLKVRRSTWHCAIARSTHLPLLALPRKVVSNRQWYGTGRTRLYSRRDQKMLVGFGHRDAAERSIASLEFGGDALLTDTEIFVLTFDAFADA